MHTQKREEKRRGREKEREGESKRRRQREMEAKRRRVSKEYVLLLITICRPLSIERECKIERDGDSVEGEPELYSFYHAFHTIRAAFGIIQFKQS